MVSVLGRFFVVGRGSPLLVGAVPLVGGCVVSLDISRSVPDELDMLRGRFMKGPFKLAELE
jgi:hypothetical protein